MLPVECESTEVNTCISKDRDREQYYSTHKEHRGEALGLCPDPESSEVVEEEEDIYPVEHEGRQGEYGQEYLRRQEG
ncbi:MAG: hypothetical protein Q8O98_00040 [bacterium]|nr:hypothetical protein [bacterium]